MMQRPLIAITTARSSDAPAIFLNYAYPNAIWDAGAIGIPLAYTDDLEKINEYAERFDGFLFTGGGDVDPSYYNEENQGSVGIDADRDRFEEALFRAIYKKGKPIMGICRGTQAINVFLGGSLNQDIPNHGQKTARHIHEQRISLTSGGLLARITERNDITVNSFHHQSVKALGEGLVIEAKADDGCIEGISMPDYPSFFLGVQFHPEGYFAEDLSAKRIFQAFVDAAKVNNM